MPRGLGALQCLCICIALLISLGFSQAVAQTDVPETGDRGIEAECELAKKLPLFKLPGYRQSDLSLSPDEQWIYNQVCLTSQASLYQFRKEHRNRFPEPIDPKLLTFLVLSDFRGDIRPPKIELTGFKFCIKDADGACTKDDKKRVFRLLQGIVLKKSIFLKDVVLDFDIEMRNADFRETVKLFNSRINGKVEIYESYFGKLVSLYNTGVDEFVVRDSKFSSDLDFSVSEIRQVLRYNNPRRRIIDNPDFPDRSLLPEKCEDANLKKNQTRIRRAIKKFQINDTTVEGDLDLKYRTVCEFEFENVNVHGNLNVHSIVADELKIKNTFIDNDFDANLITSSAVTISNTSIGREILAGCGIVGRIFLSDVSIKNAFRANQLTVQSDLAASDLNIGGQFSLQHSLIGRDLLLPDCRIGGDVYLGGVDIDGKLSFNNCRIASDLKFEERSSINKRCTGARRPQFTTLDADRAVIDGDVNIDTRARPPKDRDQAEEPFQITKDAATRELSFKRSVIEKKLLVFLDLSDEATTVDLDLDDAAIRRGSNTWGKGVWDVSAKGLSTRFLQFGPVYDLTVLKLDRARLTDNATIYASDLGFLSAVDAKIGDSLKLRPCESWVPEDGPSLMAVGVCQSAGGQPVIEVGVLDARNIEIGRDLILVEDSRLGAQSDPDLVPRVVWKEDYAGKGEDQAQVQLQNGSVREISADKALWDGLQGGLEISNFVYARHNLNTPDGAAICEGSDCARVGTCNHFPYFMGEQSVELENQVDWLHKQRGFSTNYSPQLWRQLIERFGAQGKFELAREASFCLKEYERVNENTSAARKAWLWVLLLTIGHGHHVWIGIFWLLLLTFLGAWMVAERDYAADATNDDEDETDPEKATLRSHGFFSEGFRRKVFFSVDMLTPVIELSERNKEIAKRMTMTSEIYFAIHKVLGFILVSLLIAGATGIVDGGTP